MNLLVAMLLASSASVPATDNFGARFPTWLPADVREFVIRGQACGHFSSEYPYDADRKAFLDKMIWETCTGLVKRQGLLQRRYRHSTKIKKAIADAWGEEAIP